MTHRLCSVRIVSDFEDREEVLRSRVRSVRKRTDHYKFCLGCGAELPRDAAPKPFAPRTPPHGLKGLGGSNRPPAAGGGGPYGPPPQPPAAPMPQEPVAAAAPRPQQQAPAPMGPEYGATAPAPAAVPAQPPPVVPAPPRPMDAPGMVTCTQCGHVNNATFKFCASCGNNLATVGPPVQARPSDLIGSTTDGFASRRDRCGDLRYLTDNVTVGRARRHFEATITVPATRQPVRREGKLFGGMPAPPTARICG
jgi:hypothetical protein